MMPPNEFGEMILNAFGIPSKEVKAFTLTVEAGKTPVLTVHKYVSWPRNLDEALETIAENYSVVPLRVEDFMPRQAKD